MPKPIIPCGRRISSPEQESRNVKPVASLIERFRDQDLIPPQESQIAQRDWKSIIESQSVSKRFLAYCELMSALTKKKKAQLFVFTWVHSEGSFTEEQIRFVFDDFKRQRVPRDWFMAANEKNIIHSLPATFTIFRGCQESTREGISWTLSKTVAENFAKRAANENPDGQGIVVCATCRKKHVKAYLNDTEHCEQEIIVFPDTLLIENKPVSIVRVKR